MHADATVMRAIVQPKLELAIEARTPGPVTGAAH